MPTWLHMIIPWYHNRQTQTRNIKELNIEQKRNLFPIHVKVNIVIPEEVHVLFLVLWIAVKALSGAICNGTLVALIAKLL
jgi:hypothetical protein